MLGMRSQDGGTFAALTWPGRDPGGVPGAAESVSTVTPERRELANAAAPRRAVEQVAAGHGHGRGRAGPPGQLHHRHGAARLGAAGRHALPPAPHGPRCAQEAGSGSDGILGADDGIGHGPVDRRTTRARAILPRTGEQLRF